MDDVEHLQAKEAAALADLKTAEADIEFLDNELSDLREAVYAKGKRKDLHHLLFEEVEDKIAEAERNRTLAEQRQAGAKRALLEARRDLRQLLADQTMKRVAENERKRQTEREKNLSRKPEGLKYTPD